MAIIEQAHPVIKRRTKGERTRHQILLATIQVLAKNGIKGTTHRAIAKQAGIQLSLTTYYFKDIEELIHQAILLNSETIMSHTDKTWVDAFEILDKIDKTSLRKVSVREQVANELADLASHYVYNKVQLQHDELSVEQLLFTHVQVTPSLRELASRHHQALLEPMIKLISYFNRKDPEVDAEIFLTVITQLEYSLLPLELSEISLDAIRVRLMRIISYITKLKY